jgi:hypothetical protein
MKFVLEEINNYPRDHNPYPEENNPLAHVTIHDTKISDCQLLCLSSVLSLVVGVIRLVFRIANTSFMEWKFAGGL